MSVLDLCICYVSVIKNYTSLLFFTFFYTGMCLNLKFIMCVSLIEMRFEYNLSIMKVHLLLFLLKSLSCPIMYLYKYAMEYILTNMADSLTQWGA